MGAVPGGNAYDASDIWNLDIGGVNGPGQSQFVMASRTDGTLWGWGRNFGRMIKPPTADTQYSPYQISGTTWNSARFGPSNTAATKTDGTLWIWGENDKGNLGQNESGHSVATRSSPIQIPGTNWNDIYIWTKSFLATKTDGTLWAWGENPGGVLGINATTQRSSPTQIPGTTWSTSENHVSGGGSRSGAIKTDGTLWTWGYNANGDLGHNNRTHYSSPVQVGSESTWNSICIGGEKMIATKTDGTLWGWGNNYIGSLGLNTATSPSTNFSSPVQVGSDTDWDNVTGLSYSGGMATKTDGSIWMWGDNTSGTLGQNDRTQRSSPVQIPGTWGNIKFIGSGSSVMAVKIV